MKSPAAGRRCGRAVGGRLHGVERRKASSVLPAVSHGKGICTCILIQLFNTLKQSVCLKTRIEQSRAENSISPVSLC